MIRYYDPDGRPISMDEWISVRQGETWERERLRTEVGKDCTVSTVWLGLDHNWGDGDPLIWETLIFGGPCDQQMWRYATRAQAHAGHEFAVRIARAAESAKLGGTA